MQAALEQVSDRRFESIGADAWGCDYGLLRQDGSLVEQPYTYRDARTDGVMSSVFARVPRERIYAVTGIQFLWFNTLFQLYAASQSSPQTIAAAHRLGMIPDVLNLWLSGSLQAEYTNATTTQLIDASTRTWATGVMEELGIPTRLLPGLVEPGTVIGKLRVDANATLAGTPVVAPASHDTARHLPPFLPTAIPLPEFGNVVAARHRNFPRRSSRRGRSNSTSRTRAGLPVRPAC